MYLCINGRQSITFLPLPLCFQAFRFLHIFHLLCVSSFLRPISPVYPCTSGSLSTLYLSSYLISFRKLVYLSIGFVVCPISSPFYAFLCPVFQFILFQHCPSLCPSVFLSPVLIIPCSFSRPGFPLFVYLSSPFSYAIHSYVSFECSICITLITCMQFATGFHLNCLSSAIST